MSAELGAGLCNNLSPPGSLQNTRATFVPEKQTHECLAVGGVHRGVLAHRGPPNIPPGRGLVTNTEGALPCQTRAPRVSGAHCLEEIKSSHFTDEEPKGEELTSGSRCLLFGSGAGI